MSSGPSKTRQIVLWGSSLPALLAASFLYFPRATTGPVLCPLALMTGIPCPGCGLTRAFSFAAHGHLQEALEFHPLWPLVLGYFLLLWVYKLVEVSRGRPPRLPTAKISGAALAVLLVFWAVRLAWFFTHGGLATMAHDNAFARLARVLR